MSDILDDLPFRRPDGRAKHQLRPVSLEPGIAPHAHGSVLCSFGQTKVICAATIENKVPPWMMQQGVPGGWLTAEYSMLPYSTTDRKQRDSTRGKTDGRTIEIQRLIGRSLRAVTDLLKIPGKTIWIDCDVLQADGGTRTAAITGAYVAAQMAVRQLLAQGAIRENPLRDAVAAISVGVYQGHPILDLCYIEDKDAAVDANIVMTGAGEFVEVQSSGEEAVFTRAQLDRLLELAGAGIEQLIARQQKALA